MHIQTKFRQPAAAIVATGVHTPDVAALVAQSQPTAMSFYRANEVIFSAGDNAGGLYLITTGAVRIVRLTEDGRRQISGFHFAGEVFGFEPNAEHHSYAESVDGAGIRVLRPANGTAFAVCSHAIALKALERAHGHALILGRLSAIEKLAAFLLDLLDRQDSDRLVNLAMQRNDIADYLGLTIETVSRVLKMLKDLGIIRLTRIDQIEILDPAALESFRE
jgi:CRP/FNR family nitrogen fixation transcriptional regulator